MTSNFHPHLDCVNVYYVVLFSQNRYLYFDVGIAKLLHLPKYERRDVKGVYRIGKEVAH